jgi:hypothetical protein
MDFRECYFFASPHRQRFQTSTSQQHMARIQDAAELNTDEAFILCGDFVTEIVNAFMPEAKPWCERGPGHGPAGRGLEQGQGRRPQGRPGDLQRDEGLEPVSRGRQGVLSGPVDRHRRDVDRAAASVAPIINSAVPLRELDVNLGPYGEIDDRFVVRYTRNVMSASSSARKSGARIGDDLKKEITEKPKAHTRWCGASGAVGGQGR